MRTKTSVWVPDGVSRGKEIDTEEQLRGGIHSARFGSILEVFSNRTRRFPVYLFKNRTGPNQNRTQRTNANPGVDSRDADGLSLERLTNNFTVDNRNLNSNFS